MATRTVRLDEDSERVLARLTRRTGLSVSSVLKRGLRALEQQQRQSAAAPYQVFEKLDLGEGGYAIAPSTDVRRGVRAAIARRQRGTRK